MVYTKTIQRFKGCQSHLWPFLAFFVPQRSIFEKEILIELIRIVHIFTHLKLCLASRHNFNMFKWVKQ